MKVRVWDSVGHAQAQGLARRIYSVASRVPATVRASKQGREYVSNWFEKPSKSFPKINRYFRRLLMPSLVILDSKMSPRIHQNH